MCEALLQRLAQNLQTMAAALGPCIQKAHPVVREGPLTRPQHVAPSIKPTSEIVWFGARHTRVVTLVGISVRPSGVTPQDTAKTPS